MLPLTVGIVLNHEVIRHVPVVEDLRSQDVSANSPRCLVAFALQPLHGCIQLSIFSQLLWTLCSRVPVYLQDSHHGRLPGYRDR